MIQNEGHAESGSLLFYILIAVVLFAALAMVVARDERGSTEGISSQQAEMYASEILDYANVLGDAVSELRLRGCKDYEISFENSTVSGYVNGNAPTDHSCHVFHEDGAGLEFHSLPSEIENGASFYSGPYFTGDMSAQGAAFGSNGTSDLVMLVGMRYREEICQALNHILVGFEKGAAIPAASGNHAYVKYYDDNSDPMDGLPYTGYGFTRIPNALHDSRAGCYSNFDRESGLYVFYYVLLVRV